MPALQETIPHESLSVQRKRDSLSVVRGRAELKGSGDGRCSGAPVGRSPCHRLRGICPGRTLRSPASGRSGFCPRQGADCPTKRNARRSPAPEAFPACSRSGFLCESPSGLAGRLVRVGICECQPFQGKEPARGERLLVRGSRVLQRAESQRGASAVLRHRERPYGSR